MKNKYTLSTLKNNPIVETSAHKKVRLRSNILYGLLHAIIPFLLFFLQFTYPRLACQNIFLDDYKHCKLHDFTLRELQQDYMQIAHESLSNGDNPAKRDVWNYGQLLLKIYTFDGLLPMPQAESVEKSDTSTYLENLQICPNKM